MGHARSVRPAMSVRFPDSARFNEHGRRLLVSLDLIDADPLRCAAEEWLLAHEGPETEATLAVRADLGDPYPAWMVRAADAFQSYGRSA